MGRSSVSYTGPLNKAVTSSLILHLFAYPGDLKVGTIQRFYRAQTRLESPRYVLSIDLALSAEEIDAQYAVAVKHL